MQQEDWKEEVRERKSKIIFDSKKKSKIMSVLERNMLKIST